MKYIDADLLRKEVKGLEKSAHKSALGCADSETRKFHEGKDFAYQHVGILINSLRQEQPRPDHYTKVREIKTGKEFWAEYSIEAAEWYEAGTGNAYSISDVEIVKEQPDKSLEEEIDRFEDWMETYNQSDYPTSFTTRDIARHFAEWQKSQMPMPEDTVLFNKGVAEGKRLMIEDAVEGEVIVPIYEGDDTWSAEIKIPGTYNIGDKVRIVVLKAEEESK